MSAEPERLEQDLAEIPLAGLPTSFREEILDKACIAPAPSLLTKWWNSTPKPVAAAVAAAWIAIAVLKATTPSTARQDPQPTIAAEPATDALPFIAWAERHRSLLQTL